MKISKKVSIALFSAVGLVMAAIIIVHQNPGPIADPTQELVKKIISFAFILGA